MNLKQLGERAAAEAGTDSLPIDQCRRRVNALVSAGVISGVKIPTEKNRWDYGEEALRALVAVLKYEKAGTSSKDAVKEIARLAIGQPRDAAELELENKELREAIRKQAEELRRAQEMLKRRRERMLPVEWSPVRALWTKLKGWFKSFDPEK